MTNDEMRIAVAESLGWAEITGRFGVPPVGNPNTPLRALPNFPSDLNAINEAVRSLSNSLYKDKDGFEWHDQAEFVVQLERIVIRDNDNATNFDIYSATAAQRCEACLRVKGLWKE